MSKKKNSEVVILEDSRVTFDNVESRDDLSATMAEFGYDAPAIKAGKAIYQNTRNLYDVNKREDDETSAAYADFEQKQDQLDKTYRLHRKKAKVIFRDEPQILKELELDYATPKAYLRATETKQKFYDKAIATEAIHTRMARLKVTLDELTNTRNLLAEMQKARSLYVREKQESQSATDAKDKAFAELDKWMSEFYAVARIAFEDNPQALEAFGKIVRN